MKRTIGLAAIALVCSSAFATGSSQRILTFEDRVAAQKAIEQVYWNHRIWPAGNPGPKPPLSAVMPNEAIRAKVEDYLKKSNALEKWWHRPITAEQLQAEMDRMAKSTKDGATLQELHDALGNDPLVIAETLVRQTLVDRLSRTWYASDSRFQGEPNTAADASPKRSYDDWWTGERATIESGLAQPSGTYAAPAVPATTCTSDSWSPTRIEVADPRSKNTAVWTGAEMIVWGGDFPFGSSACNSGGRYVPATDSWTLTSTGPNVPTRRDHHTAVWTGTEMIVWGGSTYSYPTVNTVNTGGRYNPSTDSWVATSTAVGVPDARDQHTAVWTGTEMIVWGGSNGSAELNTGGRYNPVSNSWTATSLGSNVPAARRGHTAVWTGSGMVVWGGNDVTTYFSTGGRYSPATDTWTPTSTGVNLPSGRYGHTAVWTGSEMIVWGGYAVTGGSVNTGGRYNPSTDHWATTSTGANVPSARNGHAAVWTGTEMIVWGGISNTGARYKPGTDAWIAMSTGPNDPFQSPSLPAVWTGTEMIVWGGGVSTGGRYSPSSDSWVATSTGGVVPSARGGHTAVWTGTEMIIWGGTGTSNWNTGGRYIPATDSWTTTSTGTNVPTNRYLHTAVWTGTEMIVWGGVANSIGIDTGGRYNPASDAWTPTSVGENVPSGRYSHAAVWTGREMIVWGGNAGSSVYPTGGGRYDTSTDSWSLMSASNVPAGREDFSAVWTGTEMIVWGGFSWTGNQNWWNSGGRYNPSTETWTATSTGPKTPASRQSHTAVWTGTEMIVWGGRTGSAGINTGGRYNPGTDGWAATSTGTDTPSPRYSQSAVWTGAEMIVWGGNDGTTYLSTGGRYSPATDTWTPTSTGVNLPSGRSDHTVEWTGTEMIVWGGTPTTSSGGRYCACPGGHIYYHDVDGDGFGDAANPYPSCDGSQPVGSADNNTDCDDSNASVHPGASEICDGLDDNCNGVVDEGGSALCDDNNACTSDACHGATGCSHAFTTAPCDDGNLCTNGDTCNAGICVAGVAGPPPEIHVTMAGHAPTTLSWAGLGGGTTYDLATSTVSDMRSNSTSAATCLANDVTGTSLVDSQPNPAVGDGYYYLIRAQNVCGTGSYGFDSTGVERVPTAACP